MNAEEKEESKENSRGVKKVRDGVVVSDRMDKTAVVAITQHVRHRQYGKFIRRTRKYYAHDEKNQCKEGDRVRIVETRPLSKQKRWRLQEVLVKAV